MPVNFNVADPSQLFPVPGLRIGTAMAGIRKANRRDLVVFLLDEGSAVAGVFTKNRFCAAPVQLCQAHLAGEGAARVRALVVNTGNANAGTGADGLARAARTCEALATHVGVAASQVLPFSTGVIMETLPVERIEAGLPAALADASAPAPADGARWAEAAQGIMTTDTVPKAASTQVTIGGRTVTVTGISKGAGMIRPNMATMLGFVATDAVIAAPVLQQLVREAADEPRGRRWPRRCPCPRFSVPGVHVLPVRGRFPRHGPAAPGRAGAVPSGCNRAPRRYTAGRGLKTRPDAAAPECASCPVLRRPVRHVPRRHRRTAAT